MKIYRSGNQFRADHDDQVHITNLKDLSSISMSDNKCIQMQIPDGPVYPFDAHSVYRDFKLERAPLEGEEMVDGHNCKMETITYTRIGAESVIKMKLWEAEDLDGFPIKIEVLPNTRKRPFTFHFTDVSLQTPDAALFKTPANCVMLSAALAASSEKKAPAQTTKAPPKSPAKPAAKPAPKPPQ